MSPAGLTQLEGVTVVDFTQALSGPYCSMMLADLGADVIKIEAPERGDDSRHWGPPFAGADAAYFMSVNRNKRSVVADLKEPDDLRAVLRMIEHADVVLENWRPGTADRLGLGAERLREMNPRLVYCSVSGFGADQGPRSGYDQIVQGTSGVMQMTGPVGHPTKWGVPVADVASGMFAAAAVIGVLYERERTGHGRTVDVAMQDSLVAMLTHHAARYLQTGVVPVSDENGHATIAPYGSFKTSDGFVNICVGNNAQFARMCEALGCMHLLVHDRYATNPLRVTNKLELATEINACLSAATVDSAVAALERFGVPAGPVSNIGDVLSDPATALRRMIVGFNRADSGDVRVVNTPWKIDQEVPAVRLAPPLLGEHTAQILADPANLTRIGPAVHSEASNEANMRRPL